MRKTQTYSATPPAADPRRASLARTLGQRFLWQDERLGFDREVCPLTTAKFTVYPHSPLLLKLGDAVKVTDHVSPEGGYGATFQCRRYIKNQ